MDSFFAPLFASGRIIDLILLLVAAEAGLLAWLGRRYRRPGLLADMVPTLGAGALLLLTVRAALIDLWWGWVALALALALLAHLLDVTRRLRRSRSTPAPRDPSSDGPDP